MKNGNNLTVRSTAVRDVAPEQKRVMKQTMQIPLDELMEDLPVDTVAHLDVLLPDETHVRVQLEEKPLQIGREDTCDLCLPLHNVSRVHARIVFDREEHVIEDLDSTNGTYLNNVRIACCTLRSNDHIRIGEARLTYIKEKIQRKA